MEAKLPVILHDQLSSVDYSCCRFPQKESNEYCCCWSPRSSWGFLAWMNRIIVSAFGFCPFLGVLQMNL